MVIWVLVNLVESDSCEALTDVNLETGHLQRYKIFGLLFHKELLVFQWRIICVHLIINYSLTKFLRFYTCRDQLICLSNIQRQD